MESNDSTPTDDDAPPDKLARAAQRVAAFQQSLAPEHVRALDTLALGAPRKTVAADLQMSEPKLTRLVEAWTAALNLDNTQQLLRFWGLWANRASDASLPTAAPTLLRRFDTVFANLAAGARAHTPIPSAKSLSPRERAELLCPFLWREYVAATARAKVQEPILDRVDTRLPTLHSFTLGVHGLSAAPTLETLENLLSDDAPVDLHVLLSVVIGTTLTQRLPPQFTIGRNTRAYFSDRLAMQAVARDMARERRCDATRHEPSIMAPAMTAIRAAAATSDPQPRTDILARLHNDTGPLLWQSAGLGSVLLAFANDGAAERQDEGPDSLDFVVLAKRLECITRNPFKPRDLLRAVRLRQIGDEFADHELCASP